MELIHFLLDNPLYFFLILTLVVISLYLFLDRNKEDAKAFTDRVYKAALTQDPEDFFSAFFFKYEALALRDEVRSFLKKIVQEKDPADCRKKIVDSIFSGFLIQYIRQTKIIILDEIKSFLSQLTQQEPAQRRKIAEKVNRNSRILIEQMEDLVRLTRKKEVREFVQKEAKNRANFSSSKSFIGYLFEEANIEIKLKYQNIEVFLRDLIEAYLEKVPEAETSPTGTEDASKSLDRLEAELKAIGTGYTRF